MHSADQGDHSNDIMRWWDRLQRFPAGGWLFSFFLSRYAPYSGSISPRVEVLGAGYARVSIRDRKKVRNHLKSIHAIALINLGEVATGLAVLTSINNNMRGIVLGLEAEYLKKARGKLVANAKFELPQEIDDQTPVRVTAELLDQSGDVVTRVHATWLLGFKQ